MRRAELASLLDVVTLRRGLEVEAARQAAERRTARDLARLRTLSRSPDRGALGHRVRRALQFHTAVVDASHNPLLGELYRAMTDRIATGMQRATARHLAPLIAQVRDRL